MILPALTLGLVLYGDYTLIVRSAMLETLGEDYVLTARAKGMSNWAIVWKHGFRNALLPIVTLIALSLGFIIGGAITIEYVFDYPGIGLAIVDAIDKRDYAVPPGRVPAADVLRDPVQLHRRPALLQARPAGDDVSRITPSDRGAERRGRREGSPDLTPGRRGFISTTLRSQPQAIVGLMIVVVIILIAIFAPLIATYSIHAKTGPIYAPPSAARTGWARTTAASTCSRCSIYGSRVSLEVGFAAALRGDGHRRGRGHRLRVLRRLDRRAPDADHRHLPGHPRPPADHRHRSDLRPQPVEHHHHHRHHLLDEHGTAGARPGEERPRAGLRPAGPVHRRGRQPAHLQARAAAGGAAPDREHRADDRAGDVRSRPTSPSSVSATRARSRGAS